MGISPFKSSTCACGKCAECESYKASAAYAMPTRGFPDPRKFKLGEFYGVGDWLVVTVCYPDAVNFEGQKILVFKNVAVETLRTLEFLDPHFCEGAHISPVARFRPDPSGWDCAVAFAQLMVKEGV